MIETTNVSKSRGRTANYFFQQLIWITNAIANWNVSNWIQKSFKTTCGDKLKNFMNCNWNGSDQNCFRHVCVGFRWRIRFEFQIAFKFFKFSFWFVKILNLIIRKFDDENVDKIHWRLQQQADRQIQQDLQSFVD